MFQVIDQHPFNWEDRYSLPRSSIDLLALQPKVNPSLSHEIDSFTDVQAS